MFDSFFLKVSAVIEQITYSTDNLVEWLTYYPQYIIQNIAYAGNLLLSWFKSIFFLPSMDFSVFKNLFALALIIAIVTILIGYIYSALKDINTKKGKNALSEIANIAIRWFAKYFIVWWVIFWLMFIAHYIIKFLLTSSQYGAWTNNSQITLNTEHLMYNTYTITPRAHAIKDIEKNQFLKNDCDTNIPKERIPFKSKDILQCGFMAEFKKYPKDEKTLSYPDNLSNYWNFAWFATQATSPLVTLKDWNLVVQTNFSTADTNKSFFHWDWLWENIYFWKMSVDPNAPTKWMSDNINMVWGNDAKTYYLLKGIFNNLQYINEPTKIKDYNVREFFTNEASKLTVTLNGTIYGFRWNSTNNKSLSAKKTIQIPITMKVGKSVEGWRYLVYRIFESESKEYGKQFSYGDGYENSFDNKESWEVKFFEMEGWNLVVKHFDTLINAWLVNEYYEKMTKKGEAVGYMPSLYLDSYFFWGNYFLSYSYDITLHAWNSYKRDNIRTSQTYKYTPWFLTELLYQYKKGVDLMKDNMTEDAITSDTLRWEVASLIPVLNENKTLNKNVLYALNDDIISIFKKNAWQGNFYLVNYIPLGSTVENWFPVNQFKSSSFDYIWNNDGSIAEDYKGVFQRTAFIQSILLDLRKLNDSIFDESWLWTWDSENSYNKSFYDGDVVKIFDPIRSNTTLAILGGWIAFLLFLWLTWFLIFRAIVGGITGIKTLFTWEKSKGIWFLVAWTYLGVLLVGFWTAYERLFGIVFIVIFLWILFLKRRRTANFLDKWQDSLKKKQEKLKESLEWKHQTVWNGLKYMMVGKIGNGLRKITRTADNAINRVSDSITQEWDTKSWQSGSTVWETMIKSWLSLLFTFIFLALAYRIGIIGSMAVWTPIDAWIWWGVLFFLCFAWSYISLSFTNHFFVDIFFNVLKSQLVDNQSFFNSILSQYANLSQVDKMTTQALNVDKIIAKQFDPENKNGLDWMVNKEIDKLTEDADKQVQWYNKINQLIDEMKDQTIGKIANSGKTLYNEASRSITEFKAKTDLHWLSGALWRELGVQEKKTFFWNLVSRLQGEELKSIHNGKVLQDMLNLNDLKRSGNFSNTFDGIFDMLKNGEKNIFAFNATWALKNIPSYIKSNQERLVNELEKYNIDLNDDSRGSLKLLMNTFSKGNLWFLDKYLNEIEHPYRKKYGKEKMVGINNLINKFVESDWKDFDKLTQWLTDLGVEVDDISDLSKKAHWYYIDSKVYDKSFNKKMLQAFSRELDDNNKVIINNLTQQAHSQNNKMALWLLDYVKKWDYKAWYDKYQELEATWQFRDEDKPLLWKVEELLAFMASLEDVVDLVRTWVEWETLDNAIKKLNQKATALWQGTDSMIEKISWNMKKFAQYSSGVDQYALKFKAIEQWSKILNTLSQNPGLYNQTNIDAINDIVDKFFEWKISIQEAAKLLDKVPIFDKYSSLYNSLSFEQKNIIDNNFATIEDALQSFERERQAVLEGDTWLNKILEHFLSTNISDNSLNLGIEREKEQLENTIKQVLDPTSDKSLIDVDKQVNSIRQNYLKKLWYENIYWLDTISMIDFNNPNTDYIAIKDTLKQKINNNKNIIGEETVKKINSLLDTIKGEVDEDWNIISENDRIVRQKQFNLIKETLYSSFLNREEWGIKVSNMITSLDEYFTYLKTLTEKDKEEASRISRKKNWIMIKSAILKETNKPFELIQETIKQQNGDNMSSIRKNNLLVKTWQIHKAFNDNLELSINKIIDSDNYQELEESFTNDDIVKIYSNVYGNLKANGIDEFVSKEHLNKDLTKVIKTIAVKKINEKLSYNKENKKSIAWLDEIIRWEISTLKRAFRSSEMKELLGDNLDFVAADLYTQVSQEILSENMPTVLMEIEETAVKDQDKLAKMINSDYYGADLKESLLNIINNKKEWYNKEIASAYQKILQDNYNHMLNKKTKDEIDYSKMVEDFNFIIKDAVDKKLIQGEKHMDINEVSSVIKSAYNNKNNELLKEINNIEKDAKVNNRKLTPEEAQQKFVILNKQNELAKQQQKYLNTLWKMAWLSQESLYMNSDEWINFFNNANALHKTESTEKNLFFSKDHLYKNVLGIQEAINNANTINEIDILQNYRESENNWIWDIINEYEMIENDLDVKAKNTWFDVSKLKAEVQEKQKFFKSFEKVLQKVNKVGIETWWITELMNGLIAKTIQEKPQWQKLANDENFKKLSTFEAAKILGLENYEFSNQELQENNVFELQKLINKENITYADVLQKNKELLNKVNSNIQSKTWLIYDKKHGENEILKRNKKIAEELLNNNIYESSLEALQSIVTDDLGLDINTKTYSDIAEKIVGSWNKMAVSKMADVLESSNVFEDLEKKWYLSDESDILKKEIASMLISSTKEKINKREDFIKKHAIKEEKPLQVEKNKEEIRKELLNDESNISEPLKEKLIEETKGVSIATDKIDLNQYSSNQWNDSMNKKIAEIESRTNEKKGSWITDN